MRSHGLHGPISRNAGVGAAAALHIVHSMDDKVFRNWWCRQQKDLGKFKSDWATTRAGCSWSFHTLEFTASIQSQLTLRALIVKCMQRCTPLYRCETSCASTMNSNHARHACCMRSYMLVIQLFIRQLNYSNPIISTNQWGSCLWTNQSWKWMCSSVPRCSLWDILLKADAV